MPLWLRRPTETWDDKFYTISDGGLSVVNPQCNKIQSSVFWIQHLLSPPEKISEKSTQVGRTASVLYVHKFAKLVATVTKFPHCTEHIPVISGGQKFSSILHKEPLTKALYQNYIILACNPLNANVVKLEDGSYQKYGENLNEWNIKIY